MTGHTHRRWGRALLALIAAITAGLALASARSHLTDGAGLAPPTSTVVTGAQWVLWLLTAYVVVLVTITATLVLVGRPRSTLLVLRATPLLLRPAVGALLGVSLAAVPAAAAAVPAPTPPTTAPSAAVDPFDWSAPPDAVTALDLAGTAPPPRARPSQAIGRTVRVRAGDCLWSLAARDLAALDLRPDPAEVAASWPRWYEANRAAIGPDPSLLHPGELLRAPEPADPILTTYSARRPR